MKKIILFIIMSMIVVGCTSTSSTELLEARTKNTIDYFGTLSTLTVYDDFSQDENNVKFEEIWLDLKNIMEEIDQAISVSIEDSEIAQFNALEYGESVEVSHHTANILTEAKEISSVSEGLYDPTVYPLVDLWAFTPRFNSNSYEPELLYDRERIDGQIALPEQKYVEGLTALVDFDNVILSGNEEEGYRLTNNIRPVEIDGQTYYGKLDLGGIAKGYMVDVIMDYLAEAGYAHAYFSCGTSSMGFQENPKDTAAEFNVNIRKPREGNTDDTSFMSVALKQTTLSSSGDYDHNYLIDDELYSHIINGQTGYPMNVNKHSEQKGIANVVIFGDSAMSADALTTVLCLLDLNDAISFINQYLDEYKVILVVFHEDYDYYEVLTNLTEDEFSIHDDAYQLASEMDENGDMVYTGRLMSEE